MITYTVTFEQRGDLIAIDYKAPPSNATPGEAEIAKNFSDMMLWFAKAHGGVVIRKQTPASQEGN